MPSTGGSGEYGGDDTGHGSGGVGSGANSQGGMSGQDFSNQVQAMMSSPSPSQYNDYYASKLGVMGQPGATWGDFTNDLSKLGSGLYDKAMSGFLGLVDTPINFANRFGASIPTFSTPTPTMAPLTSHDPTAYEQARGYTDFGVDVSADVAKDLRAQHKAANPDQYGWGDALVEPAAKMVEQVVASVLNPLAAMSMFSAGIPPEVLANPYAQKATGFLTGGIGSTIADMALTANTLDKISGTGVYGGNPQFSTQNFSPNDMAGGNYEMAQREQQMPYSPVQQIPDSGYKGYMNYGNYGNYKG